jgi:predicted DNA-binding transcriptional regulator AlpA
MPKVRSRLLTSSRARNDSVIPAARDTTGRVTFSSRPVEAAGAEQLAPSDITLTPIEPTEDFAQRPRPPPRLIDPPRLLNKREVTALVGRSYDSLWRMMCAGKFPRGRYLGQKVFWFSVEIEQWLADLPKQRLKGDVLREDDA